jgi:hypothetical protein
MERHGFVVEGGCTDIRVAAGGEPMVTAGPPACDGGGEGSLSLMVVVVFLVFDQYSTLV